MESTLYVFLPDGVFLPCDQGLDVDITYTEIQSIKSNSFHDASPEEPLKPAGSF